MRRQPAQLLAAECPALAQFVSRISNDSSSSVRTTAGLLSTGESVNGFLRLAPAFALRGVVAYPRDGGHQRAEADRERS